MREGALDPGREALVEVAAALASRRAEAVEATLREAGRVADPTAVEEVILQSHLFVGFPDALEAMATWREISGREPPPEAAGDDESWPERGERVCRLVYGENYEKLRSNVRALHADLDRWMIVGGYGRVLGRGSLDLPTRELCIVALLTVWRAPRQLHSHLRGALNAGAEYPEVERTLEIAARHATEGAVRDMRAVWNRVRRSGAARAELPTSR